MAKIGPVERWIMEKVAEQEERTRKELQRRTPFTDYLEYNFGLSQEEVEEQIVSGCLDEAEQRTAPYKLGVILREQGKGSRKKRKR